MGDASRCGNFCIYGTVSPISHLRSLYPTLTISPLAIAKLLREHLEEKGILVNEVKLKGSGASFCLADHCRSHPALSYNDLDIGFDVKVRGEFDFSTIREVVMNSLLVFFPEGTRRDSITSFTLEEAYVHNQVKIWNGTDQWSLICLGGESGMNITFVSHMERQYKFSVDSFQITLDPLLSLLDATDSKSLMQAKLNLIPRIHAISTYGNIFDTFDHLNQRLISTNDPQQIRGGGLLKYCYLRATGFKPVSTGTVDILESSMSTRFVIDFPIAQYQY